MVTVLMDCPRGWPRWLQLEDEEEKRDEAGDETLWVLESLQKDGKDPFLFISLTPFLYFALSSGVNSILCPRLVQDSHGTEGETSRHSNVY
jgi:hypothetical protein